ADLLVDSPPARIAEVRLHRDARHVLDAGRDDEVELARPDGRRSIERGLQRRAALTVDRRRAHRLRPARDEDDAATDVESLLADLRHAPHLHVFDGARVELRAPDEAVQNLCRELVSPDVRKRAVPAPDRRPNRIDYVCLSHAPSIESAVPGTSTAPNPSH